MAARLKTLERQALAVFAVLLAAACFVMARRAGIVLPSAALALAALGIWLPGRVLAQLAGAQKHGLLWTASWVFGLGLFAVCTALGSASGRHWLAWLPAVCGASGAAALWQKNGRPRPATPAKGAGWLCAGAMALMAFYCLFCAPQFAHAAAGGGMAAPEQDFLWNVGNAKSFLLGFPPRDLRFSGYVLTYHYLSELLCAGLAMGTGADCYNVQAALLPLLGIAFTAGALWECGGVLYRGSRRKSAALLALTYLFGSASLWKAVHGDRFLNSSQYHLLTNINGMGFALGLVAAFFAVSARLFSGAASGEERPGRLWAPGGAAFVLLCFAKGPVAGVAVLALVCAAAVRCVGAVREGAARRTLPVLAGSLALLAVFGALYAAFFSAGAGASVALDPFGTLRSTYFSNFLLLAQQRYPAMVWLIAPLLMLACTVCYAPAAVPPALAGGVADLRRIFRLPGEKLMLYAGFLGGFAAFFLFYHSSSSQMYFAFFGLFCADALAVENVARAAAFLQKRAKWLARVCAALLSVLAAAGLMTTGFLAAGQWKTAGPVYARSPEIRESTLPLTADEEAAMRWLAANTPETALLATNRSHTGAALEGLSNVYSGLSGRRFYMESFKYAKTNLGVPDEEIFRRVDEMRALFGGAAAPDEAAAFCRAKGIDYVVYSRQAARYGWDITEQVTDSIFAGDAAPEGFALVFANGDAAVYEVLPDGGPA